MSTANPGASSRVSTAGSTQATSTHRSSYSRAKEEAVLNARRSQRLFDPLFTTERMREIFSDHGRVQAMLDFEAALARGQAKAGVIPGAAAAAIEAQCRAELFDVEALAAAATQAGNSAIPL